MYGGYQMKKLLTSHFFDSPPCIEPEISTLWMCQPYTSYRLKDAKIEISFSPYDPHLENQESRAILYRYTMKWIENLSHQEQLIHMDEQIFYDVDIEMSLLGNAHVFQCPSCKIHYRDQALYLRGISWICLMKEKEIFFRSGLFSTPMDGKQYYMHYPPYKMSDLSIEIYGDLEFYPLES